MDKAWVYILILKHDLHYYIGYTTDLKKRYDRHLESLKAGRHQNVSLQKVWNESKTKELRMAIMFEGTKEEAFKREQNEIALHKEDRYMTNIGIGMDNTSRHPNNDEIRKKISKATKAMFENMSEERRAAWRSNSQGKNNGMYGKRHTPESRAMMSAKMMGHSFNRGVKLSPEHVAKISARQKLRVGPKNSFFGKRHSEKTKEILRLKNTGHPCPTQKAIEVNGIVYKNATVAAKELGISLATLSWRARNKKPKYSNYRYLNDS